jgi:glutamine synthetase adenylyltransferase
MFLNKYGYRVYLVLGMTAAEIRFAVNRLDPHHTHEALYVLAPDLVAASRQNNRHLSRPVEGRLQIVLVDQTHQLKISRAHRSRLAVHGGAR